MASITPVSVSDGSTEAKESFSRSMRGFDVAFESTFELVVVPSTAIRRRAINRMSSCHQQQSDVEQSNVCAHQATKHDWQLQQCAHLPYETKKRSNRVPAMPVLNAFAIAKRFANKLTR
jgi:hypothetical protein